MSERKIKRVIEGGGENVERRIGINGVLDGYGYIWKKKRKELWPIYKFRINLIMMQLYEIRVAAMHGDSKGWGYVLFIAKWQRDFSITF